MAELTFDRDETLDEARRRNIDDALREDIGRADWTGRLVPADLRVRAVLRVREAAVLAGRDWFAGCLRALDAGAAVDWRYDEGARMAADSTVCEIVADARALLSAERPALNFLQLLSATATRTRAHVDAIAGVSPNPRGCAVLDTRKTLPGLRQAQKYAVRVGGGQNQRLALWDGILIKENHIAAAGGIGPALRAAAALQAGVPIQIEVEDLAALDEALAHAVVDVAGRPYVVCEGEPEGQVYALIGGSGVPYAGSMTYHVFEALALNSGLCLHVTLLSGRDPHHIVEAQFKALARALREAVEPDPRQLGIPSTKGAL